MEVAAQEARKADIFMVVGTSLVVYPAAGLVHYVPQETPIYVIDPHLPEMPPRAGLHLIEAKAGEALPKLATELVVRYT
jgi:NAD-dependent deacetylase